MISDLINKSLSIALTSLPLCLYMQSDLTGELNHLCLKSFWFGLYLGRNAVWKSSYCV